MESLTDFDRTTALSPGDGGGRFVVELSERWASLVGVHGGYLAAIATQGAQAVVPDRRPRTIATTFHRPAQFGAAHLTVDEVRRGRSLSHVVAELHQDGRALVTTRVTMLAESPGVDWGEDRPLDIAPVDSCVPIEPPMHVEHFLRADGRLDPSSIPFTDGPRTETRGYVRPLDDRAIDAPWLAMICDWFPPPAFVRMTPPIGGVSVDMMVHVHRTLPPLGDGWLAGSFGIETSHAGLAVERGRIVTPDGRAVADSVQTRWTIG